MSGYITPHIDDVTDEHLKNRHAGVTIQPIFALKCDTHGNNLDADGRCWHCWGERNYDTR